MDETKGYKYTTNSELFSKVYEKFEEYLHPLFKSFNTSKKTFSIQVLNFVLVFIILFILLDGFWENVTNGIQGSGIFMMKLFFLLIVVGVPSAFASNEILKWQTLFEMEYRLSKQWLISLSCVAVGFYVIKTYLIPKFKGLFTTE